MENINSKQVLTLKEVSQYTGFSLSTLYKLTHKNLIPFYKPNRKTIFIDRLELIDWLKKTRISSHDELENEVLNSETLKKIRI